MRSNDHLRLGTAGPTAAENEGEVEGPFGNSVTAVLFCLMTTAVFISIFLFFERFMSIRQTQSPPLGSKLPPFASPKMDVSKRDICVNAWRRSPNIHCSAMSTIIIKIFLKPSSIYQ